MKQLSLFTEKQLKQPSKEEEIAHLKEYIIYLKSIIVDHARRIIDLK